MNIQYTVHNTLELVQQDREPVHEYTVHSTQYIETCRLQELVRQERETVH